MAKQTGASYLPVVEDPRSLRLVRFSPFGGMSFCAGVIRNVGPSRAVDVTSPPGRSERGEPRSPPTLFRLLLPPSALDCLRELFVLFRHLREVLPQAFRPSPVPIRRLHGSILVQLLGAVVGRHFPPLENVARADDCCRKNLRPCALINLHLVAVLSGP
jgi:hypothetical protein